MALEYDDSFEHPEAERAPDQNLSECFMGTDSVCHLEQYLKESLSASMRLPSDPEEHSVRGGTPADTIRYLEMDVGSLAIIEGSSLDKETTSYKICAPCIWNEKGVRIFVDIREGATFSSILKQLESVLCDFPNDALSYLQRHELLPQRIGVVPSTGSYGQTLAEDTRYTLQMFRCALPDPRAHPEEYVYEKALETQKTLHAMAKNKKIRRLHIDMDPKDRWSVILYAMRDDFIRRFRGILEEAVRDRTDFPRVLGPSDSLPAKYLYMKLQDINIAVDPAFRDFHVDCVNYVLGKVRALSEEWKEIVLRVIPLQQASEGFDDNGGLALLHDPREGDGVTVQFHCRNPHAL